jgi:hypothetical protein
VPIHCERLKLSYFPIPKNGTSTMRAVLRAINDEDERISRHVRTRGADVGATEETSARNFPRAQREYEAAGLGYERLVLIREPLRRFYSGFQNKVRNGRLAKLAEAERLPESGLPTRPDLETFVDNLDQYRAESFMIRRHFYPQSHFTGRDLSWYHHVYQLERFGDFARFMSDRLGQEIAFPHVKKQDLDWVADVSPKTADRIRAAYERDFRVLADFYPAAAQV